MRTFALASSLLLAALFGASSALASAPPVPSTWNVTPVNGNQEQPSTVTFDKGGKGTAKAGSQNIQVEWRPSKGNYFWFYMSNGQAFQAFKYAPSKKAGFSCAVNAASMNFKCTDNGYNFSMTQVK